MPKMVAIHDNLHERSQRVNLKYLDLKNICHRLLEPERAVSFFMLKLPISEQSPTYLMCIVDLIAVETAIT